VVLVVVVLHSPTSKPLLLAQLGKVLLEAQETSRLAEHLVLVLAVRVVVVVVRARLVLAVMLLLVMAV
jgi:hypothetical protein